ncbi:MAG: hypothetical protein NW203_15360 [Hyphomonadaceae bacterium]|nr:hypothetical protein [Hyphomonadaceae bacterium]
MAAGSARRGVTTMPTTTPIPTPTPTLKPTPTPAPAPTTMLAARLQAMVERELEAVDRVLAVLAPENPEEGERAARTLASLARALRELAALRAADHEAEAETADDDDPIPRDIDEFRRELARRIEAFVGERAHGGVPDGSQAALERLSRP